MWLARSRIWPLTAFHQDVGRVLGKRDFDNLWYDVMMNGAFASRSDAVEGRDLWPDLLTVDQAAQVLRISVTTLWRRIRSGEVPAYRLGGRRVWVRQSEIERLVQPARTPTKGRRMATTARTIERPLTSSEQERWFSAIDAARAFQSDWLDQRGGQLFRPAEDDIAEARGQRSAARR